MDRLRLAGLGLTLVAAACGSGDDKRSHVRLTGTVRVRQVVLPAHGSLGRCLALTPFRTGQVVVVERAGRVARSLTVTKRGSPDIFVCDKTGVPLEGREWCGFSAGRLRDRRVTDPRLDLLCRDARGRHVAAAFVNAMPRARWVAVDQGAYTELYPTAARLPVRIASTRGVEYGRARATFLVTQLDRRGLVLVRSRLVARVAG